MMEISPYNCNKYYIYRAARFPDPVRPESYNEVVPKAKELEMRLQRIEQQLRLFQKVSRFMVREMSLQDVLQGVVSLVVEFSECDSCLVYLLDGEDLVLCASNTASSFYNRQTADALERRTDRLGGARAAAAGNLARGL